MQRLVLPLALSLTLSSASALSSATSAAPWAAPCAAPSNDGDSAETARADVARLVDLRAFDLLGAGHAEELHPIPVIPLLQVVPRAEEVVPRDEGERPSEVAFRAFSELHGGWITTAEFVEPGVLYMEAPAEAHAAFADLLQRLEALLAAAPRLRVTRFAADADQLAAARAAGGDAWRGLAREGLETTREITLPASRLTRVRELIAHSTMYGLEVEIAEAAAIGDPLILDVAEGLDLALLGSWSGNTLRLAYIAQETEREERDVNGPFQTQFRVAVAGSGLETDEGVGWHETFGLIGGAAAGETALRRGDATILSTRPGHHVAIELLSAPPSAEVFAMGAGKSMLAVARGAFAPARVEGVGNILEGLNNFVVGEDHKRDPGEAPLRAQLSRRDDSLLEMISRRLQAGADCIKGPDATLLVFESEGTQSVMDATSLLLGESPSVYTIRASWTCGEGSGTAAVETIGGTQGLLAVGAEGLLVRDFSVEVAKNAAIRDPEVTLHFEGLACAIQVDRLRSGDLAFVVEGQVSQNIELVENPMVRSLAATSTAITRLNERGTAAPSGQDSWKIVLGDESGQALRVELEVRRVR